MFDYARLVAGVLSAICIMAVACGGSQEESETQILLTRLSEGGTEARQDAARQIYQQLQASAGGEETATDAMTEKSRQRMIDAMKTALVSDENPRVRMYAATAMGSLGGEENSEALLKALEDDQAMVQSVAAQSLGLLEYQPAESKLRAIAENPDADSSVRIASVTALGSLGVEESKTALLSLLKDENPALVAASVKALKSYDGEEVMTALNDLVMDPRPVVRKAARRSLQDRGETDLPPEPTPTPTPEPGAEMAAEEADGA